jgi:hypothetical protein
MFVSKLIKKKKSFKYQQGKWLVGLKEGIMADRILNRLDWEQRIQQLSRVSAAAASAGTRVVAAPKVVVKTAGGAASAAGRAATKEGFFFYLILAVAVHLIDWGSGFPRSKSFFDVSDTALYSHLLVAFVVWLVFFFRPEELQNSFRKFVPLLLIAYFAYIFPIIGLTNPELRYSLGSNILTNPIMHPIWLYAGLFIFKQNKLARLMLNGIVLFWFTYLFFGLFSGAEGFGYSGLSPEHYATVGDVARQYWSGLRDVASTTSESISNVASAWFKANVAFAAGPYYSGEAEESKPVGVIIEKMEGFPTQFPVDKTVVVNAWIKALEGVTEPIKVKSTACWSEQTAQKTVKLGESFPKTLTVFPGSEHRLRCSMRKALGSGSYNIHFAANYELDSRATLDTFFADLGKKYEADRAGIDLLEDFPSRRAIATYTNGPVMVGVGVAATTPVVVVNEGSPFCSPNAETRDLCEAYADMPLTLGITLDNRKQWEGEATSLNNIRINLPKGLELNLEPDDEFGEVCDFTGAKLENPERNIYDLTLKPELGGPITNTTRLGEEATYKLSGREYSVNFSKVEDTEKYNLVLSSKSREETIEGIEAGRVYRKLGADVEIKNIEITEGTTKINFSIGIPLSSEDYNAFQCDLTAKHADLLGDNPVAPKSIVVNINYNFMTKKAIGIRVKQ